MLLINALKKRTNKRVIKIIIFVLFEKKPKNPEIKPFKTLVWTTPWPNIKSEITVIREVLLKPLRILCGLKRFWPSSSLYGKIEKKTKRKVNITID